MSVTNNPLHITVVANVPIHTEINELRNLDREALKSAYCRGYSAMMDFKEEVAWGASLYRKITSLKNSDGIIENHADYYAYAALRIIQHIYFDGRKGCSSETMTLRNYGKGKSQMVPILLAEQLEDTDLLKRINIVYGRMMLDELTELCSPEFSEKFELNNIPCDLRLINYSHADPYSFSNSTDFRLFPHLFEVSALPLGYIKKVFDSISTDPFSSILPSPKSTNNHNLPKEEVEVGSSQPYLNILQNYERYRTETLAKNTPGPALTMRKGTRYMTYISENHGSNGAKALEYVKRIAIQLEDMGAAGDLIFLESSLKNFDELLKAMSPNDSNMDGFIYQILFGTYNFADRLKPLEYKDSNVDNLSDLEKRLAKAKGECDKAEGIYGSQLFNNKIDENLETMIIEARKELASLRSILQAEILNDQAPEGHSWAFGGQFHLKEVEQALEAKGWEKINPQWVIKPPQEEYQMLNRP